jgi:hypothetical protein
MFLSMGWFSKVALSPRPPYPAGELVEVSVDLCHVVVEAGRQSALNRYQESSLLLVRYSCRGSPLKKVTIKLACLTSQ